MSATRSLPEVGTQYLNGAPIVGLSGGGLNFLSADDARLLASMRNEAADRVEARENYGNDMPVGRIYPDDIKLKPQTEKAIAAPTTIAQESMKGSI